ncbi:MAG: hypothetical protein RJA36_1880 [Pseudomonadota bacterium]|jgi:L-asparaginase
MEMAADTLVVLGMGGTIAGRARQSGDLVGYRAGEVGVGDLLHGIPVPAGLRVEAEQVAQVDSKDMGPAVWRALVEAVRRQLLRPEVRGIVVTHGTDTLEESAWLLQRLLNPRKPVVLTCAMRPASALVPDGPQNLADALVVAAQPAARGVVAVCAGRIHAGAEVRKVHHFRLDAFDSGDVGALGAVEQGGCMLWRPWPDMGADFDPGLAERLLACAEWPRVECLFSHGGADGWLVRALLAHARREGPERLRGLVVAGTGNGTLHEDLLAALRQAQAQGVEVRRTTRCASGRIIDGGQPHAVASLPLPPAQARLALLLELL